MSAERPAPIDLDALKAGDPEAQQRFWAEQWERVYHTCGRILGYGADANDVATDVLTDFLFNYVQRIEHARAVTSYVRLMATRRSLRRRKGRDRHDELVAEEVASDGARSQEVLANAALLMPKLADCLAELTPKAQQVLKLRFGAELVNEKIGQLVGGSKQYIGRLITQSAEKLRICMERGAQAR